MVVGNISESNCLHSLCNGQRTLTSTPNWRRASGSAPTTSPSPPARTNGPTSGLTKRTFIYDFLLYSSNVTKGKWFDWQLESFLTLDSRLAIGCVGNVL